MTCNHLAWLQRHNPDQFVVVTLSMVLTDKDRIFELNTPQVILKSFSFFVCQFLSVEY